MLLCLQSPSETCLNAVADKDAYKEGDGHGGQWLWQHSVSKVWVSSVGPWAGGGAWAAPVAPQATSDLCGHATLPELSLLPDP